MSQDEDNEDDTESSKMTPAEQEAEYATLKGQHDAVQQAAIEKKCMIHGTPVVAPAPAAPVEKQT